MFELIKTLTEMSGPIGQEHAVVDYVEKLWQDGGARTSRTKLNNLFGHVGGSGPKVLLVAHADELCYLVRAIDDNGFLWLANGQGWGRTTSFRDAFTIGQRVRIMSRTGEIPGVIATAAGHIASLALPNPSELSWNDFWVDTGLSKAELEERGVTPGTRIIWDATTERFGSNVVGKALDDRVLLAVLTELLGRVSSYNLQVDLTLGCSVQEEIGVIGAFAMSARREFDYAIALEIGLASDIPTVPNTAVSLQLGKGPALVHKDSMVHYDHRLTTHLEEVAKKADIPIQHAIFGSFGSDGSALMKADIPSAMLAFPARYTHTPFETANLGDIEALVDWLEAFVKTEIDD